LLEGKISKLEKVLKQPYLDLNERPYFLHGILIHDGLAENGHYYSYIYERTSKRWWKMNDHKVEMEMEENVMKEALGGSGYKSACNLIYISEHVKDIIEGYGKPTFLFTDHYG
jgi:ubiquitin carboxyl-terminal hydrolase 25|tara:strand:- start:1329 stop:1667 length:339 start_codon:yes stop_codon:yes gene_type:complete